MGAEKTFYQRLFRVPVAPVGTSINEQDDSWLRSSEDPPRSKSRASDGYTHPYDQQRKAKATAKSSHPKKSRWQRMKEEEEERKARGPSPISSSEASLISGHSGDTKDRRPDAQVLQAFGVRPAH